MSYEIYKFNAAPEMNKTLISSFTYYWNADQLVKRLTHAKGIVYGIYDTVRKRYVRFYHNYSAVLNPTANIENIKDGSY